MAKRFYEAYWSTKPDDHDKNREDRLRALLRLLTPGEEVLDVGCGRGETTAGIAAAGFKVTGMEISPVALAQAREKYRDLSFTEGSLEEPLPFPPESFDAVFAGETLEHLMEPVLALRHIHRVLRPRGKLVVTVPYHGFLKNLAITLFGFYVHYHPLSFHVRFFTPRTLSETLRHSDFAPYRVQYMGRLPLLWKTMMMAARRGANPGWLDDPRWQAIYGE